MAGQLKTISFEGAVVKDLGYKRHANTAEKVYKVVLTTSDGNIMNLDGLDQDVTFAVVMAPEARSI